MTFWRKESQTACIAVETPGLTPIELEESPTGPVQVWSSPFRIQNDHQLSVHNHTMLNLELCHFKCMPAPHRLSCLVPRTRHCHTNKVIHRNFQGALLRHPRMLHTPYKTWRHCRWPWIEGDDSVDRRPPRVILQGPDNPPLLTPSSSPCRVINCESRS